MAQTGIDRLRTLTAQLNQYRYEYYSRPLAKLAQAVKVADASNQGKTEGKALSSVTVTFREDTKPYDKADGVFNKDTFS